MTRRLRIKDRPTAIFAVNDDIAMGIIRAAYEEGFRVPSDLAFIGFDNVSISESTNPPLTTVHINNMEVMKELAARWMLKLIDNLKQGYCWIIDRVLLVV